MSDIFRALADPTRRRILDLVRDRERPVNELLEPFRVTQSAVSQHLRVLREAGLVRLRRVGRQRLYRAEAGPMRRLAEWAGRFKEGKTR
ncbi:MAG: metalloregulator ArsR/SmtB family transcription factor [Thermoanaerobaculia bacterium]